MKTFFKKLGKDILYLSIDVEFDLVKFPILLQFFPNLKTLKLKDAIQLNVFEGPFPDSLNTLIVAGLSHNFEFAFISKIPNLETVQREYVNYYMLTNQIPKGFIRANERLKSLLSALDVHSVSKTDLNYMGTQEITPDHITHLTCSGTKEKLLRIGTQFSNLKSLSFDFARTSDENDQCFFGHETVEGFKSVTSLILNERDHEIDQELCEECFETFLSSFKNVDKLTMHTAINQKLVNLILVNLEKLREVSLFSHNKENLYDFQLDQVSKLEKLNLWSKNNASMTDQVLLKWPWMPNLLNIEISLPLKNVSRSSLRS